MFSFTNKEKNHYIQLCDPNTEGMILSLVDKKPARDVWDKEFRQKCKDVFKDYFDCDAHRLKEKKLKEIFNSEEVFKKILLTR